MTNNKFLKHRLFVLFTFLVAVEVVNLVKLGDAMVWTNGIALGTVAAVALGAFLIGSVMALSFDLEPQVRSRLEQMVWMLVMVQTALVCIVSYLHSLTLMPAPEIATLFGTPVEPTRKVIALAEGVALNLSAVGFWNVLGTEWKKEIEREATRRTQLLKLEELDIKYGNGGSR